MSLTLNDELLDRALHRIPALIAELQLVESHLMELRAQITEAIEDEDT